LALLGFKASSGSIDGSVSTKKTASPTAARSRSAVAMERIRMSIHLAQYFLDAGESGGICTG
jgi:hypothetical protein